MYRHMLLFFVVFVCVCAHVWAYMHVCVCVCVHTSMCVCVCVTDDDVVAVTDRHNTVVMMEMQDTINELQRELSALGKSSARKARSATSSALGLAVSGLFPSLALSLTPES